MEIIFHFGRQFENNVLLYFYVQWIYVLLVKNDVSRFILLKTTITVEKVTK